MGIFLKTLKRHSASRRVPQQAFQLVTLVRWDLGVRMERKPVDTGTAGARQRITAKRTLREFWEQPGHQDAEQPLKAWYAEVQRAAWRTPADVKTK